MYSQADFFLLIWTVLWLHHSFMSCVHWDDPTGHNYLCTWAVDVQHVYVYTCTCMYCHYYMYMYMFMYIIDIWGQSTSCQVKGQWNGCCSSSFWEPGKIFFKPHFIWSPSRDFFLKGNPPRTTVLLACEDGNLRIHLVANMSDTVLYWLQPRFQPVTPLAYLSLQCQKKSIVIRKRSMPPKIPVDFFEHCQRMQNSEVDVSQEYYE